jgi:hypothetical protein
MHAVTEEMGSERKYLGRRKCEHHRRLMRALAQLAETMLFWIGYLGDIQF